MAFYTETISFQPRQSFITVVLKSLKAFGRGTWNFMESMGRARAAAELHRMGYTEEAKALMLQEYK